MKTEALIAKSQPLINAKISAELKIEKARADFPILQRSVHGKQLVYLDNAATTQKPRAVIEATSNYYENYNSNIHRGLHFLSEQASEAYESSRSRIQRFMNATQIEEIIFVRGATEAINLVAQSYGRNFIRAGDEIVISTLEHHSNIVPWQILCEQVGAILLVIPINDLGEILLSEYEKLLTPKTKFVSLVHVSNALGTINPIKEMIKLAHAKKIPVLIDGAQAAPHFKIDVQDLDCDFYVFSGHKMYGPTGIGVLFGKKELLDRMPPYQGGGDMIVSVSFEKTQYNVLPFKFEAGTPNIVGAIGLGVAIEYLQSIGIEAISEYEKNLLNYSTEKLSAISGIRLIGQASQKASVLSFLFKGVHPHDIGTILDREGIAIRAGHHCTQPLMQRLGIPATARASFSFYNTKEEIDRLCLAIEKVREVFADV